VSQQYSEATQEILQDFLHALNARADIDPDFLAKLHRLTTEGKLGHRTQIQRSIVTLEAKADELQDRHDPD
jgi:hypothetical protein